MRKYEPVEVGVQFDALLSDIHSIDWRQLGAVLEFYIPDSDDVLQIAFDGMTVLRVLDEFHLSTEDDPNDRNGMAPHHFAYKVTGHLLKDVQSIYLRESSSTHYQFLTGRGCADVITNLPPIFSVRPLSELELTKLESDEED